LALAARGKARKASEVLSRLHTPGIEDDRYRAGHAWGVWIRWLRKILKKAGLPFGVRTDRDLRQSPFVVFVNALQRRLPAEFRHPASTLEALADAIDKVRNPESRGS
jgi:hypothetical protein